MPYPIGTPGIPWAQTERDAWRASRVRRRSYAEQVVPAIRALADRYQIVQYGTLTYPEGTYPLLALHTPGPRPALITGGVHGYETSGVMGALRFAAEATEEQRAAGLAIAPCVSPWAFEVIDRWTPAAIDPNRSFVANSPVEECRALMRWVATLPTPSVHIDLHETTDSDNTDFRPAKAARDGVEQTVWTIPDGFYLVGRTDRPVPAFQAAVRDRVAQVTHIAEADEDGCLIGVPLQQHGVITYDAVNLGLCMGITDAPFATTTEVYPDSPRVDGEIATRAQVAAVQAALDFARAT